VGGFVAEAQARIAERVDLPPGSFRLEWGGQFENMQRAQQRLMIVVPLALRDMPLSISAAVGFITLSGVSVLSGMVVASALRERLAGGDAPGPAIEETSCGALRTIIMTALVASLGFIPMALSEGTGADV